MLRSVFGLVKPAFPYIDAIVEGEPAALVAEGARTCLAFDFHNACTFITRIDLQRGLVVEVREYVDTLH